MSRYNWIEFIKHDYFGVDYEIVWEAIQEKIPELHYQIEHILNVNKN